MKGDCILDNTTLAGKCLGDNCSYFDRQTKKCTYIAPENRRQVILDNRAEKGEEVK